MSKLEEFARTSRELANALFSDDEVACSQQAGGQPSCVQKEEDRPLTKEEKRKDWARRPFFAYDPDRMCAGCRAYFFAEMAAQTLHEMRCWQVRIEAEAKRKKQEARQS